jgi:chemotaxis response regulator CheB
VFFESVAEHPVAKTFATLLSGMGSDGAEGLARLTDVGARTAVQSLESCVVPGMPQAALHLCGRIPTLTPLEIAAAAARFFGERPERKEICAT